jgi:hypothetical protein
MSSTKMRSLIRSSRCRGEFHGGSEDSEIWSTASLIVSRERGSAAIANEPVELT